MQAAMISNAQQRLMNWNMVMLTVTNGITSNLYLQTSSIDTLMIIFLLDKKVFYEMAELDLKDHTNIFNAFIKR
jgi:hypothetical protein